MKTNKCFETKLDILLATYNGGPYLDAQIDSLVAQSCRDWTLMVHDDGSTDDTVAIVKRYEEACPGRIVLLEDNASFRSASLNFGYLLEKSDASYIMFCDQDDVWYPEKIEKTMARMLEMEQTYPGLPLLVHTDLEVTDEDLHTIDDSFWHYGNLDPRYDALPRLLMQNFITGCTMMINRKLMEKALPIPENAIMHDWWLGLVASRFGKIGYLPEATVAYRQHAKNDTGAQRFGVVEVLERTLRYFDASKLRRQLARNRRQAGEFLDRFEAELLPEERQMLAAFSDLERLPFRQRRCVLLQYGLLKQGWIRNAGLLTRI